MSGEAEGEQGASGEPGKLLAVIADEDTVTGLLLAGVGACASLEARKPRHVERSEASLTRAQLAGHAPAHTPRGSENFFVVRDDTSDRACAEAFAKLAAREDVVRSPPSGDVARAHHDNSKDEQKKNLCHAD